MAKKTRLAGEGEETGERGRGGGLKKGELCKTRSRRAQARDQAKDNDRESAAETAARVEMPEISFVAGREKKKRGRKRGNRGSDDGFRGGRAGQGVARGTQVGLGAGDAREGTKGWKREKRGEK